MRKILVSLAALYGGICLSSATVTVQGWWHFGEGTDYYADSSGNGHRFANAFSRVGSGNAGAAIKAFGCGGPLGTTGWTSANCLYWNSINGDAAGMWNPGFNPPSTNYVIECWCLPVWPGTWTGATGQPWLFCSGTSGGVCFQITNDTVSTMAIVAKIVGNNVVIGDPVVVSTNHWTHLAVVNDNGTQTFYVNGVQHGAPNVGDATVPSGAIYAGSSSGTTPTYAGYLDELRISTFAPGAFSISDLLLRPTGPNITAQPQSTTIWDGGAAPFSVTAAFDTVSSYQWQRNSTNIPGATASSVVLPQLFLADTLTTVRCIASGSGLSATSSTATVTVVAPNPANVMAYRNVVVSEPSLAAYFPVDGCTGATLTNVVDAVHNGTLEFGANYVGITNRAFAQRALAFATNGDVAIPNNAAFEFGGGNGTIEALVYVSAVTPSDQTIFSLSYDYGGGLFYAFRVSADGSNLRFSTDDSATPLSWPLAATLIGQLTHVALVIDHATNVTAFANGQSLGTKVQNALASSGAPAWIGSSGLNNLEGYAFAGTIDELAVYTSALPANTIATHNSKFISGTNQIPPTITSIPGTGSKTLLAGGSATFTVAATGTPVLTYQWTTNGIPIPGATRASLTLSPTTIAHSGTYGVTVANAYGTTNSPTFSLTFVPPADTYSTKVMADNPSAYWRLGEIAGTNGATAYDLAGGHDGTYVVTSAPGFYSTNGLLPGVADRAVTFTGYNGSSGAAFGCVEVPYSPVFNQNAPFSVECFHVPFYDGDNSGGVLVSSYARPSGRQGWMLAASYNSVNYDFYLFDGSSSIRQINSAEHCYPNVLIHEVGVYDGTNAYIYINGALSATWTGPITYAPNASAALTIGARTSRYLGFQGVMDEVAFYSYALSQNQISNHFASLFSPAAITAQPVGVTNVEGSTITLTAAASGYVNTYQWFKDGSTLGTSDNADGTPHYPQNVTNPSLVIAQATPADSGSYRLIVYNSITGTNTIAVNVLITNDLTPPVVTSVRALGTPNAPPNPTGPSPYLVRVTFSKRIVDGSGTFAVAGASVGAPTLLGDVNAAIVGADWRTVILPTAGLTPGASYTLNVSGVKDQTTTGNRIAATNVTFRAPVLSRGLVAWDYYHLGTSGGNSVSDLANCMYYPNAPMTNWASTTFDSSPITGGDLAGAFGSAGEHYGCSLSAWITPTVSGNYYFFIASDDPSELWLSSNADPQNAALIAQASAYTSTFKEPGNENTSALQALVAGQSYFIRALQTENEGGDWVKVAWRIEGNTTAAASLQPISGDYLSSYAPGPVTFKPVVYSGGVLTFSWVGTATLLQSTDIALPMSQWTPVATTSPFQVTPAQSGPRMFYRLAY